MNRFLALFLVILALLPITVVPAAAVGDAGATRIASGPVVDHRADVFGLVEAPRAEAASTARPGGIELARAFVLPTSGLPAVAPSRPKPSPTPRSTLFRRRCPEPRAGGSASDPPH